MKKRILSIALCLIMLCSVLPIAAMAASNYELWVGGVQVTSDNAANITGDGISGKVSYDAATKTLTLENATITGAYEFSTKFHDVAGIYTELELTIRLIGENTITGSCLGGSSYGIYARFYAPTITGNGHLNVSAAAAPDYWSVGIYSSFHDIKIEDGCSLTASCATDASTKNAIMYNLRYVTLPEGYIGIGSTQPDGSDASVIGTQIYPEYTYIKIDRGGAVTLNTDGGAIASGDVKYYFSDAGVTLPQNVTKEDYIFGGWYDNADCTGQAVTKIPAGETSAKEYWAKWTKQEPVTQPTEPTTQPTEPTTQPTEPTTQPTEPTTQPTEPATQPTEPTTQPTEPTTPGTVPGEPATEPSQSATEPSTTPQGSATQPENNQTGTPDDPQNPPIGLWIGIGLGVVAVIAIVAVVVTKKKS